MLNPIKEIDLLIKPSVWYITVVRLGSTDEEKNCRFLIHALQVSPQHQYKKYELEKFVTLSDLGETTQAFPVMVSFVVLDIIKVFYCWRNSQTS